MIDAARALAASLDVAEESAAALADHVVRDIERLEALRHALAAFIEQPEAGDAPPIALPPASHDAKCPDCEWQGSVKGLGPHRRHRHGGSRAPLPSTSQSSPASAAPKADGKDPREIDALCGRGCGRRFRWSPALANHERSCDGTPKAAVA